MGRPARSLHDAGNHRAVERRSPRQAARRGGGLTIPASPAGERETTAALTPLLGARSSPGDDAAGSPSVASRCSPIALSIHLPIAEPALDRLRSMPPPWKT